MLLLYSAAFNNLASYLNDDIKDLTNGWVPDSDREVLLVYTHSTSRPGAYHKPTNPYLIRLYRDQSNSVIADTIKTYPTSTISSSATQLREVLSLVRERYISESYGMIFSSHASGYLPVGYYSNPEGYVFTENARTRRQGMQGATSAPYIDEIYDPSLPAVKSLGQDVVGNLSYEMDLRDFADAIPMHLDYILFDACLMGGIEVAYELRDKCSRIGFSQAEVLAEGLDYKTLTRHLLEKEQPDPMAVCEDYFNQYDSQTGVYRSATISFVDCTQLEQLAGLCKGLLAKYRDGLADINPNTVQRFYRFGKHWFYDLESILSEAGISDSELSSLHESLNKAVLYKAATPEFIGDFKIKTFSGFSMYLPCHGSSELDKYYRTLEWNKATALVE